MPEIAGRKRLVLRGLTVALGLLLGLVIFEGVSRMIYQAPWYERLIAEQRKSLDYSYKKNHWGFRDGRYSRAKPPSVHRILILGDSFTFGQGVADRDKIFPEILEKRLGEVDFGSGIRSVEVLNAGIPGSMPERWLSDMTMVWDNFKPDTVIIVFFLRDGISEVSIPAFFNKIRKDITTANRSSFFYRNIYTVRMLKDRLDRRRISDQYTSQFVDGYLGDEEQTERWRQSQETLVAIRDFARQRSAAVGFVVFPILVQLDEHYPFQGVSDHIETFARDHDMPTHNLLPTYLGHHGPDLWVSPYDQHPNETAHLIAAESILPFITGLIRQSR